jgi:hypothetical protein
MKNSKNMSNKLTNNTLSDTSNYILYTTSNYKTVIDNSVSEILTKFVEVILEYMRFISEKIIMKKKSYYRFIFERGIETLIHVFSVIFYFTKNLELTFYHTQKAYYFYIEFIEQISDDNVTFLQLSSRDAILFVYKKTIFDLNNEYKKTIHEPTVEEKNILATVDTYIHIYKCIVLFIINHTDFKYENKNEYINTSCDAIEFVSETLNKNKIKSNHIECVYLFITLLDDKKIDTLDFFRLLDQFIKKVLNKKKFNEKVIKNKIYDSELSNFINNNELNKIVDWIFSG